MMARIAATLTFCCLLSLALSLQAQDSLLGHHTINLQLKPLPAAEVLNVLSARSKMIARLAHPPTDEGRAWEVDGAEQLEGLVVAVNFVETPVPQVIGETLGCIGFAYQERADRIVIEKAAQALPAARCRSVSRMSASAVASSQTEALPAKTYSWQLASTSALELIDRFSRESGRNIMLPFTQIGLLRNIQLRVNVSRMPEAEVLQNLFGCIGWQYEQTSAGISASKPEAAPPATQCRGFTVLP
jgi:hypothetical protein